MSPYLPWPLSNLYRWDCISINDTPVHESLFRRIEQHYLDKSLREGISASPFEILTATAFTIFNEEQVKLAVVEVGMGGKLDATNILNNQVMCVIAKIARDHESFLGNTLSEIALHKAGILRENVPYIINPQNEPNVEHVITQYGDEIGAVQTDVNQIPKTLYTSPDWQRLRNTLLPIQQANALLAAVAAATALGSPDDIPRWSAAKPIMQIFTARNPGRLEIVKVPPVFGNTNGENASAVTGRRILVDGAHNPDAARMLCNYVNSKQRTLRRRVEGRENSLKAPKQGWRVTWVIAMTEGKDAERYLSILLQPGDTVITTTFGPVDGMPWVKPMDPKQLLEIAQHVQPSITGMAMPRDGVLRALCAAKYLTPEKAPIVLTGSLYLVGDFHRELRPRRAANYMTHPRFAQDRIEFEAMLQTEQKRVRELFSPQVSHYRVHGHHKIPEEELFASTVSSDPEEVDIVSEKQKEQILERTKLRDMQAELAAINETLDAIGNEEQNLLQQAALQDDSIKSRNQKADESAVENESREQQETNESLMEFKGLMNQTKEEKEIEEAPHPNTPSGGLRDEMPTTQPKGKLHDTRDAFDRAFEKDTGPKIRKHTGYIKKTVPDFRKRFGDATYAR
ncbi:dihydrofolate synthetase Fol3 [Pyrenophora seminiperda CCB06]|uniref:Dihydrofolate synthetase Fol3 n=1 Tax=Pyrenophora seminiperda CCB06 TaxID=1302712 RepID=A0A3M7LVF2_9PLEO|nr:dihydrofolate synthetase Fol3 [Pyrenophora seminiperda CCB06]